jgi:hypothetical protein
MNGKIRTCVERFYEMLVEGKYADLAVLTGGIRLSADEIRAAASGYPYALRPWPPGHPMFIDAVEVVQSRPRAWSVRADAFTTEEGRSDLSMELTVIESQSGELTVQFDNLHVL